MVLNPWEPLGILATSHKCQIGLVWLSSYFESILALNLKIRLFVQILFEFLAKIMIQNSKAFMFLLNRDLFFKIL